MTDKTLVEQFGAKQIAEWRKLKGDGMISAVGEYTPDEFWDALDLITQQAERIAALTDEAQDWKRTAEGEIALSVERLKGMCQRDTRIAALEQGNLNFMFKWMKTPNPMLGDLSPLTLMNQGRGHMVAMFIEQAMEDDEAARAALGDSHAG